MTGRLIFIEEGHDMCIGGLRERGQKYSRGRF